MKQERIRNGRCNRVTRLEKPDGLSEARDFSHEFFTGCKIKNLYYRGDIYLLQKPEKIIALIGQRNADDNVLRNAKKYGNLLTARLLNSRAFSGFYIIKNPA